MRSLRSRLLLSHFGPVLLLIPLLALALLYLVETRYALNDVATDLSMQGKILAHLSRDHWSDLNDPAQAEPMIAQLQVRIPARVFFWDRQGNLLVASGVATATTQVPLSPADQALVQKALRGEDAQQIRRGALQQPDAVDVAVPVWNDDEEVVGVVQLSQQLDTVADRLTLLRWSVWGTLAAGMLLAGLLSFLLTRSLNRPLEQLTTAAHSLRFDQQPQPVPETGPTEVRALAQTFNAMVERLHESEQMRQQLLRSMVHEIGRPLGAIKAAAQILRQDSGDPEVVKELSSGIDEQVDQLRRLVDDLALLAQSELRDLPLDRRPVDVGGLVRTECQRQVLRLREKEIDLRCVVPADLPSIRGDPDRLTQIVGNLLDNAYKYTPAGGTVRVAAQSNDGAVAVVVEDSGPGVAPEERERIFHFFYRTPDQGRVTEGMGIGLALARRLAEAHGGTLSVGESDLGGARFVLHLPNSGGQAGGLSHDRTS